MDAQAAISLFTAVTALVAAVGALTANVRLYRLDRKFGRMIGHIDALENAQNAHANAPGLHAAR